MQGGGGKELKRENRKVRLLPISFVYSRCSTAYRLSRIDAYDCPIKLPSSQVVFFPWISSKELMTVGSNEHKIRASATIWRTTLNLNSMSSMCDLGDCPPLSTVTGVMNKR